MKAIKEQVLKIGEAETSLRLLADADHNGPYYYVEFNGTIWAFTEKADHAAVLYDMMAKHIDEYVRLKPTE